MPPRSGGTRVSFRNKGNFLVLVERHPRLRYDVICSSRPNSSRPDKNPPGVLPSGWRRREAQAAIGGSQVAREQLLQTPADAPS
ncbi:MAG: hypothetical protein J2P48_11800 [Alphaproteobacteria bacterium]|nr:hypothetical protein [Alphaproteobacteria bacterium]